MLDKDYNEFQQSINVAAALIGKIVSGELFEVGVWMIVKYASGRLSFFIICDHTSGKWIVIV